MDIFEENYSKHEDFEFHEEITNEYDVDCEDKGVHSKTSKVDIDNLEAVDGLEALTRNFGDLSALLKEPGPPLI